MQDGLARIDHDRHRGQGRQLATGCTVRRQLAQDLDRSPEAVAVFIEARRKALGDDGSTGEDELLTDPVYWTTHRLTVRHYRWSASYGRNGISNYHLTVANDGFHFDQPAYGDGCDHVFMLPHEQAMPVLTGSGNLAVRSILAAGEKSAKP